MNGLDNFLWATGLVVWMVAGVVALFVGLIAGLTATIEFAAIRLKLHRHFAAYVLWRMGRKPEPPRIPDDGRPAG